jgi:hypothetical protein
LVTRINRDSGNSVISSEFFSELQLADIEKIKTAFPKHEVEIVFTVRALDALFPSNFQQALKGGSDLSYEDWLERILDDYQKGRRSSFWRRNQHALVIERWAGVFGHERVTLITSDVQNQSALHERFENLLGLKPDSLVRESSTGLNRGLLLDEISLILSVNRNYPKNGRWNEYQTFIKHGVIDNLTSSPAGNVKEDNRLRTPAKFAKQISEIAKNELANLRDLDVDVLGSFDELEPGSLLVGQNSEVKNIDLAKVAAVLASQNYDALSTIAPRSLLKNWFPYLEHRIPDSSFKFMTWLLGKLTGR